MAERSQKDGTGASLCLLLSALAGVLALAACHGFWGQPGFLQASGSATSPSSSSGGGGGTSSATACTGAALHTSVREGSRCWLSYTPKMGPLRCVYNSDPASASKRGGPCNFNVSALACSFAEATKIAPAAVPLGCAAHRAAQHSQQQQQQQQQLWQPRRVQLGASSGVRPLRRRQPERQARGLETPARGAAYPSLPGTWAPPAASKQREPAGWRPGVVFHPAKGDQQCAAVAADSAAGLVAWARRTGVRRLVISGDSATRQFFQRVVTLARGESVTADVRGQRFAHYELCSLAGPAQAEGPGGLSTGSGSSSGGGTLHFRDSLWMSKGVVNGVRERPARVEAVVAEGHMGLVARTRQGQGEACGGVDGGGSSGGGGMGRSCAQEGSSNEAGCRGGSGSGGAVRELVVDLVMGPTRAFQESNMEAYVRDVLGGGGSSNSSSGGGGNDGGSMLNEAGLARQRGETVLVLAVCYWHMAPGDAALWPDHRVLLLGLRRAARRVVLLTCPLPPGLPRHQQDVLAARNAELAALVASDDSGSLRLLDAALLLQNVPKAATLAAREYHYACMYYSPTVFKVERDGSCEDPFNFSLWQALLCLLEGE